jgi:hypothetical protein
MNDDELLSLPLLKRYDRAYYFPCQLFFTFVLMFTSKYPATD